MDDNSCRPVVQGKQLVLNCWKILYTVCNLIIYCYLSYSTVSKYSTIYFEHYSSFNYKLSEEIITTKSFHPAKLIKSFISILRMVVL